MVSQDGQPELAGLTPADTLRTGAGTYTFRESTFATVQTQDFVICTYNPRRYYLCVQCNSGFTQMIVTTNPITSTTTGLNLSVGEKWILTWRDSGVLVMQKWITKVIGVAGNVTVIEGFVVG